MKRATLLATGRYIGVTELEQSMAHIQPQAPTTLHDEETELQRIEAALKAAGATRARLHNCLLHELKNTLYNRDEEVRHPDDMGKRAVGESDDHSPTFWGIIPH